MKVFSLAGIVAVAGSQYGHRPAAAHLRGRARFGGVAVLTAALAVLGGAGSAGAAAQEPAAREASGTALLPAASPMYAAHLAAGDWTVMLHGVAYLEYIDQGGERGDDQLGSINWGMAMASRPLAGGALELRAMASLEPLTVGECGYPLLLQTGEACDGAPIHDRQHPHDLLMELAARYDHPLGDALGIELYGGPAGEPALGPVAFPHRISAAGDPLAPITHHWLDATHVSFGVVTVGIHGARWKLEGSAFNGREPDDDRWDLDLAALDSRAARLWLLPGPRWAIQFSAGRLTDAEPGAADVDRYTASVGHHHPFGGGYLATTAAVGLDVEGDLRTPALLVEGVLDLGERHVVSARAEWVRKTAGDLVVPGVDEDRTFAVGAFALGYTRRWAAGPASLGIGGRASFAVVGSALEELYGSRAVPGATIFVELRPSAMRMEPEDDAMPGMDMPGHGTGGKDGSRDR